MPHEASGSCPPVQQLRSKRCPACQQIKPHSDFAATPGGLASSCRDCERAALRLTSRRRQVAMRLLIAAHPEEWAGLPRLVRARRQVARRADTGYRALLAELQGGGSDAA